MKLSQEQVKQIEDAHILLANESPLEYKYGSRSNLWNEGLRLGLVDIDLYLAARDYYGKLWAYVGD